MAKGKVIAGIFNALYEFASSWGLGGVVDGIHRATSGWTLEELEGAIKKLEGKVANPQYLVEYQHLLDRIAKAKNLATQSFNMSKAIQGYNPTSEKLKRAIEEYKDDVTDLKTLEKAKNRFLNTDEINRVEKHIKGGK